jgi:hypothetical protein
VAMGHSARHVKHAAALAIYLLASRRDYSLLD